MKKMTLNHQTVEMVPEIEGDISPVGEEKKQFIGKKAWGIFKKEQWSKLKQERPDVSPKTRHKLISAAYHSLGKDEKLKYRKMALEMKTELVGSAATTTTKKGKAKRKNSSKIESDENKEVQDFPDWAEAPEEAFLRAEHGDAIASHYYFIPVFETSLLPTVPLLESSQQETIDGQNSFNTPTSTHQSEDKLGTIYNEDQGMVPVTTSVPQPHTHVSQAQDSLMSPGVSRPSNRQNNGLRLRPAAQIIYDEISQISCLEKSPSALLSDFIESTLFYGQLVQKQEDAFSVEDNAFVP